ncbi:MAG: TadE/TadG family type IV pilus assembly protein [Paracoccaceae bacterium]
MFRSLADSSGSAAVEFSLGAVLFLTVAVAATDLGSGIRAQMRVDGAVREAARMLAVAPLTEDGAPRAAAADRISTLYAARLARLGLAPAPLPGGLAPGAAACTLEGAFCFDVSTIPGSEPALGRARRVVTVWGAAGAPGRFLAYLDDRPDGGDFRVVSVQNRLHGS